MYRSPVSQPPHPPAAQFLVPGHTKDLTGSMWNPLFVSFPCKRTSSGFPCVAEFTAVLLLLSLFHSNLPQVLLSLSHIILSPGLQVALCLVTLSLPTFPRSPYTALLFVHFIPAIWSLRDSLAISLASWTLPCHFLDLKSLPFTVSGSVMSGTQLGCHLSREAFCAYPVLHRGSLCSSLRHPVLLHHNKIENT